MRNKIIRLMTLSLAVVALVSMIPAMANARNLFNGPQTKLIAVATGATLNAGTQMITGECYVESITISGVGTSAGDYALVYDYTNATAAYLKAEPSVGTAKDTNSIPLGGAYFANGVFADSNSDNVILTISYYQ